MGPIGMVIVIRFGDLCLFGDGKVFCPISAKPQEEARRSGKGINEMIECTHFALWFVEFGPFSPRNYCYNLLFRVERSE